MKAMKMFFVFLALTLAKVSATPNSCPINFNSDSLQALARALSEETLRQTWNASVDLYDSSYAEGEARIVREIAKMSVKEVRAGSSFAELDPYSSAATILRFMRTLAEKKVVRRSQETRRGATIYYYAREEKSDVRRRVHAFYAQQIRAALSSGEPGRFKWEQATNLMELIDGQAVRWDEMMKKFDVPVGKIEAYEFELILLALMQNPERDLPHKGESGWRELHVGLEVKEIRRHIGTLIEADLVKTKRKKIDGKDGQRITLRESFRLALEDYFFGNGSPANFAAKL